MTLSSKLTNLSIAQRVFPLVARKLTALRPVPWQRRHRGSWAPAFAGETKGGRGGIGKARRVQSGGELSHRLPGERRDPGTTVSWSTNPGHGIKFFFCFSRSQPIVVRMWALLDVVPHQIATDISLGSRQARVTYSRYPFGFQTAK